MPINTIIAAITAKMIIHADVYAPLLASIEAPSMAPKCSANAPAIATNPPLATNLATL